MTEDCVRITDGHTMWREGPSCVISDGNYGGDLFRVNKIDFLLDKSAGNTFRIWCNHESAKDDGGDPARVFYAEGAGLQFDSLVAVRTRFTGVLLVVKYYLELPTSPDHRWRYHPPQQEFKPRLVEIDFVYAHGKAKQ